VARNEPAIDGLGLLLYAQAAALQSTPS
jgi:hypothetical protein